MALARRTAGPRTPRSSRSWRAWAWVTRLPAGTLWASQSAYTYDPVLNEGAEEYKGIDIGLAYRFNLGSFGRIRTRLDGTWLKSLVFSPGAGKSFDCRSLKRAYFKAHRPDA